MQQPDRFLSRRAETVGCEAISRVLRRARELHDPIDLSLGQPDVDVPDAVKASACAAINDGQNGYAPPQGLPPLRERIRNDLTVEFGRDVGDVLITNGVTGGLFLSLLAITDPGDEAIILDPSFVLYRSLLTSLNVRPISVDTYPGFRFPADKVEAAVTPRTKILLLNSPNNPTGAVLTDEEVQSAVDIARRHDLVVVSDEIYEPFLHDRNDSSPMSDSSRGSVTGPSRRPIPSTMRNYDKTVLLRGFSKSHAMTGWRVGYMAAPQPLIARMTVLQQYLYGCASTPLQHAALTALDVPTTDYAAKCRRNRDRVVELLRGAFEFTIPEGGFYLFLKAPCGRSATDFVDRAMDRNLVLFPGSAFSCRDTHFRLSYCVGEQLLERACSILLGIFT